MAITLKNICKAYDGKTVLDNVNMSFPDNAAVCIMGESGSGKTTLLYIISGLVSADKGEITGLQNKKISCVFQENRLCDNLTVLRNLRLVCSAHDYDNKSLEDFFPEIGLEKKVLYDKVNTLSGGMKRRIAILRALIAKSEVLLLDEPTKGLDEENKNLVIDFIKAKTKEKTVIWITHDKEEALIAGDKIVTI